MNRNAIEARVQENTPLAISAYGVLTGTGKLGDDEYEAVHRWIDETRELLELSDGEQLAPQIHDALILANAFPGINSKT